MLQHRSQERGKEQPPADNHHPQHAHHLTLHTNLLLLLSVALATTAPSWAQITAPHSLAVTLLAAFSPRRHENRPRAQANYPKRQNVIHLFLRVPSHVQTSPLQGQEPGFPLDPKRHYLHGSIERSITLHFPSAVHTHTHMHTLTCLPQ